MIKKILLAASLLGATASPAYAATLVTQLGSTSTFALPALPGMATAAFTFNVGSTVPAGFTQTLNFSSLVTGDTSQTAEPGFSDGSRYLGVTAGGNATLQSTMGYSLVSFFLGSIDTFNGVQILSTTGAVIAQFTGSDFVIPANGDQDLPSTNRRVTYTTSAGDTLIGGIRFTSGGNATEVDNVVFAVPEPSTWAMMLAGFGMIGLAMRSRRRRTNVVFA
jgi:hypothetical protein